MTTMRSFSRSSDRFETDVIRTMALALPANGVATTIDACVRRVVERPGFAARQAPFIVQHDRRILVLDATTPGQWMLAEFCFRAPRAGYREVFRARYASPREAMGALLARSLADGEEAATTAAAGLDAWHGSRIG